MKASLTAQRIFIWAVACSLPAPVRAEWLAQWDSEVWHVHSEGATRTDTWRFTLGSVEDAADIRREFPDEPSYLVCCPSNCLLTMALLNIVLISLGLLVFACRGVLAGAHTGQCLQNIAAQWDQQLALVEVTAFTSLMIATIVLRPLFSPRPERARGSVRSEIKALAFHSAKLLLGVPLVYFAALALSSLFVTAGETTVLHFDASLAGYIVLLRWTRTDQNRRCPTCLKRLSSPVYVGRPSWALLDWNLQEYICSEGHGVMQVPSAPLMGQSAQVWLSLT